MIEQLSNPWWVLVVPGLCVRVVSGSRPADGLRKSRYRRRLQGAVRLTIRKIEKNIAKTRGG